MEITWEECEPTNENFWENLRRCDKYNSLNKLIMILPRYYRLEGNEDKTPKDLELELRSRNFNFGLIACKKENDLSVKKAFEDDKIFFIKPKYIYIKNKLKKIEPRHCATYYTIISCRPRALVIKETLEHSSSIEENLSKLEESGEITKKDIDNNFLLSDNDDVLSKGERSLTELVLEGKRLIKFTEVNFEEIYQNAKKNFPLSKEVLYKMGKNGESILALVNDGKIICPIGICILIESDQKVIKYVLL